MIQLAVSMDGRGVPVTTAAEYRGVEGPWPTRSGRSQSPKPGIQLAPDRL